MVFHMKTTLIIPDSLFRQLKRRAIERGETVSALVVEFLQKGLGQKPSPGKLRPLPTFKCGRIKVDVANRDELYRILDQG